MIDIGPSGSQWLLSCNGITRAFAARE